MQDSVHFSWQQDIVLSQTASKHVLIRTRARDRIPYQANLEQAVSKNSEEPGSAGVCSSFVAFAVDG